MFITATMLLEQKACNLQNALEFHTSNYALEWKCGEDPILHSRTDAANTSLDSSQVELNALKVFFVINYSFQS